MNIAFPHLRPLSPSDSQQRVSQAVVQGAGSSTASAVGLGTFTFSYTTSTNSPGVNAWRRKGVRNQFQPTQRGKGRNRFLTCFVENLGNP
jgi:hypothetical protein